MSLIIPLALTGAGLIAGSNLVGKLHLSRPNRKPLVAHLNKTNLSLPSAAVEQTLIDQIVATAKNFKAKDEYEIEINRNILLSAGAMVLSAGTVLGYPFLTWLSIPPLIYLSLPILRLGYDELFNRHKVGAATRDGVIAVVFLILRYFFENALFFTIYYISRKILHRTEDNSRKSLINIWGEIPQFVWVERANIEVEMPFDELQVGDVVVVNAGELIAVDGVVERGMGNVDQHILTGEAQLAEKTVGDTVFASSVLLSGKLYIQVDKIGAETVAENIRHILNNTTDYKSSVQARGEQMAESAALPLLVFSALTFPILGVKSAAAILITSFGSQMRVIAPISVLKFLKIASDQNILIKDGRALESLCTVDTIVFDKTGTLTQEQPYVKDIYTCHDQTEDDLLYYAAAAEYKQQHPIALAILQEAKKRDFNFPLIDEANYEVGYGIKVRLDDKVIRVGSSRFMTMENIVISPEIHRLQTTSLDQGSSLVYVAIDEQLGGIIELQATIRPEAKQVVQQLRERGMNIAIISGDHETPTQRLAQELGITQYFAEVLPENKAALIEKQQKDGSAVCFVGDGINDSIALKKANVSISLQGASTIATDTAQIILMDESLQRLPLLFDLAKSLDRNLQTGFRTGAAQGILCVCGIYFFNIGVLPAGLLYNLSLGINLRNAMWPKLKNENREEDLL